MPELSRNQRLRRFAGRALHTLVTLVVATTLAVPVVAWAGHQFGDVSDANVFHGDIDWLADEGVTKGCNPPADTRFCPGDFVTREQMAAFIHRLETEGVLLPADGKAADADLLDGKDSSAFLGATAKAADADLLDGRNSTFYRLRCTGGRLLFLGMCFELGPRAADINFNATRDCADEAMRLPSQGELRSLRELVGTAGVTMATTEWTSDVADTTDGFKYAYVGTSGSGAVSSDNNLAYRCVSGPVG